MNDFIENNKYLTDNGFTPKNLGLIKEIEDFIFNQIGVDAKNSGKIGRFETKKKAEDSAFAFPDYYAGRGIRGERTRNLIVEEEEPLGGGGEGEEPTPTYMFEVKTSNPTTPNYWSDEGTFKKTTFLDNLSSIITKLESHTLLTKNIAEAFKKIKKSDEEDGKNSKFPDFSLVSNFFDDESSSEALSNEISLDKASISSISNFLTNAEGSEEPQFNDKITELETNLNIVKNRLINRVNSGYFNNVMNWLKIWRKFWIKERILKYSGTLVSYLGMLKAKEMAENDLKAREETLNIISSNTDEWIKAPEIIATYYNPIIKEMQIGENEFEYSENRRISFIVAGQRHTEYYNVYRKTLDEVKSIGFSNNAWTEGLLNNRSYEDIYNDLEDLNERNIYIYRIQAVDNENKKYSKSLQSNILGKEVPVSQVLDNIKLIVEEEVSGFIYIDGDVNYILNSIEIEDGFELELENPVSGSAIKLNKMTCISSNYYGTKLLSEK